MKTPQIKAMAGMTPLGLPEEELLPVEELPFNLAGEAIDNSITAEGEARVRALAESEAKKAQRTLWPTIEPSPIPGLVRLINEQGKRL